MCLPKRQEVRQSCQSITTRRIHTINASLSRRQRLNGIEKDVSEVGSDQCSPKQNHLCNFDVGGEREGFVPCGQDGNAIMIGLRIVQAEGGSKQALECYVTRSKQKQHRRRSSTQVNDQEAIRRKENIRSWVKEQML